MHYSPSFDINLYLDDNKITVSNANGVTLLVGKFRYYGTVQFDLDTFVVKVDYLRNFEKNTPDISPTIYRKLVDMYKRAAIHAVEDEKTFNILLEEYYRREIGYLSNSLNILTVDRLEIQKKIDAADERQRRLFTLYREKFGEFKHETA